MQFQKVCTFRRRVCYVAQEYRALKSEYFVRFDHFAVSVITSFVLTHKRLRKIVIKSSIIISVGFVSRCEVSYSDFSKFITT